MDQGLLVNFEMFVSDQMLTALEEAKIRFSLALSMRSSEDDDWKLVLSSPFLDQTNVLAAYEKVTEILHKASVANALPFLILRTKDPFVREMRMRFTKGGNTYGMRLGSQTIGGRYFHEAFILKVQ